ncbi:matrix metallopeptidase 30 [Cynoglossus semilaevis]|uniref:matrix metallopeptidase 30 n=1 Tax=Cynoglossus semilaevis TaxID=244447 RepID=UPI000496EA5E|nr:macrophage metalloelastase-like [Cynoglossus semilaevis]
MEGAMLVMITLVALCGAAPTISPLQEDVHKAQEYLSQFYSYIGVSAPNTRWRGSLDSFEDTLKRMQEFFGLEVTGQLDASTLEVMGRPRCGFTDRARYGYFQNQPKWDKSVITYRINNYTPDLSQEDVDSSIAKALKVYSDVIPLDFRKIDSGTADILINFKTKDHGDFAPFDGEGGVLAHAFAPGKGIGGDTHFDEDENWTVSSEGYNLFLVAAHEFGHALGMAHSNVESALMYPTYTYVDTDGYQLPDDDRLGLQRLYGVRVPTVPDPKPSPRPTVDPEYDLDSELQQGRCSRDLAFDAAASIESSIYFFKDGHFWEKSSSWQGISEHTIDSVWPGISKVDAVYVDTKENTAFFFQGDHYWGVSGNMVLPGYPKPISDFGFPSYVTKIDAAVYVPSTGRTLFFQENRFWSYNEETHRMDFTSPRFIKVEIPGIGYRVDSAFENNGYLYFTHGSKQTEYDYGQRRSVRTLYNYEWMDCD